VHHHTADHQRHHTQVVGQSAVLVGNSAGALTALKVAVEAPQLARGLMLLDCSLR
jgi:pimeloyl-ACP methyl ester carboxylesterase